MSVTERAHLKISQVQGAGTLRVKAGRRCVRRPRSLKLLMVRIAIAHASRPPAEFRLAMV